MLKRILLILFTVLLCFSGIMPAFAHQRDEHDEDLEFVLFGNKDYKITHPIHAAKIQAIEDAAYLCIDQFNGNGKEELENLKKEKIPDIPYSIDEFDFNSNYAHRKYTHRGWNINYDAEAHWPIRKNILINTVNKELFMLNSKNPIKLIGQKLSGGNSQREIQCESFCALIYYVHVLGDHIEADSYTALAYVDPLTHLNDDNNPGIIPDIIRYSAVLFESQIDSYTYKSFIQELNSLHVNAGVK